MVETLSGVPAGRYIPLNDASGRYVAQISGEDLLAFLGGGTPIGPPALQVTGYNGQALAVTATAGATVVAKRGTTVLDTKTANGAGAVVLDVSALPAGASTITLIATPTGGGSPVTFSFALTVPEASTPPTSVTGFDGSTLTAVAAPAAVVVAKRGTTVLDTKTANAQTGAVSLDLSALPYGASTVSLTTTPAGGGASITSTFTAYKPAPGGGGAVTTSFNPAAFAAGGLPGTSVGQLSITGVTGGAWRRKVGYTGTGTFRVNADGSVVVWYRRPKAKTYQHLRAEYVGPNGTVYPIEFSLTPDAAVATAGAVLSSARVISQPTVFEYAVPWETDAAVLAVDCTIPTADVRAEIDTSFGDGASLAFAMIDTPWEADGRFHVVVNADLVRATKASYSIRINFRLASGPVQAHVDLTIPVAAWTPAAYFGARLVDGLDLSTLTAGAAGPFAGMKGASFALEAGGVSIAASGDGKASLHCTGGAGSLSTTNAAVLGLSTTPTPGAPSIQPPPLAMLICLKGPGTSSVLNSLGTWAGQYNPQIGLGFYGAGSQLYGTSAINRAITSAGVNFTAGGTLAYINDYRADYYEGTAAPLNGNTSKVYVNGLVPAGDSFNPMSDETSSKWSIGGTFTGDIHSFLLISGPVNRHEVEMHARWCAANRAIVAQAIRPRYDVKEFVPDLAFPFDDPAELANTTPFFTGNQGNISGSCLGANPELGWDLNPDYVPAQEWADVEEVSRGALRQYGERACPELQALIGKDANPPGDSLSVYSGRDYPWICANRSTEGHKSLNYAGGAGTEFIYQVGFGPDLRGGWFCAWLYGSTGDGSEHDEDETIFGQLLQATQAGQTRHPYLGAFGATVRQEVPNYGEGGRPTKRNIVSRVHQDGALSAHWFINNVESGSHPLANSEIYNAWNMLISLQIARASSYTKSPASDAVIFNLTTHYAAFLKKAAGKPAPLVLTNPTYGPAKFGDGLAGGTGVVPASVVPDGAGQRPPVLWTEMWLSSSNDGVFQVPLDFNGAYVGWNNKRIVVQLSSGQSISPNYDMADNLKHHVRVGMTATATMLVIDGIEIGSTVATPNTVGGQVRINNASFPITGTLDELSFWSSDRSTAPVPDAPLAGNEPGLIAAYHLDDNGNAA